MTMLNAMTRAIMEQTGENKIVCEKAARAGILAIQPSSEMLEILNGGGLPSYVWQDLVAVILSERDAA